MIVVAKYPQISQAKTATRANRNLFDPALSSKGIHQAFKQASEIKRILPSKRKVVLHSSPFLSCVQTAACYAKHLSQQNLQSTTINLHIHNELSDSWASVTNESPFPPPKQYSSVIPLLQINNHSRESFKQLYIGEDEKVSLNIHYEETRGMPPLLESSQDRRSRLVESFAATMSGALSIQYNEVVIVISHDCALQTFLQIFREPSMPESTQFNGFAIAQAFRPKRSPSTQRVLAINDHQRIKIKEEQNYTEQNNEANLELKCKSKVKGPRQVRTQSQQIASQQGFLKTQDTLYFKQKEEQNERGTLAIKFKREFQNQRALGLQAISQKHTRPPYLLKLKKSASSSSLPRRADIKEKIALSKQSVFLSKRALSKKLRRPILLASEHPGSPVLPSLLKQARKSTSNLFENFSKIKLEKCLIRSQVTRPILSLRSSTNCGDKMSQPLQEAPHEKYEKVSKRWIFSHLEDCQKA